jgi:small-conductance mechanosensitive channel
MNASLRNALSKVVGPLVFSALVFTFFYFGGEAYQTFGLAAVDSTRKALKYVLGVAAFLSLAVLAQRLIQYVLFDGIIASATGAPVPKLLSQISGLIIFIVAISACAGIVFDQDLTVLWAASGVAGLVLGMALKELLQDVFAGIALNIDRAISIGEFIQVHRAGDSKISGQVLEISWRTTRVKDFMGDVVIFPNSKFSSCTITNFSQPEAVSYRWVGVTMDVRTPLARAKRVLQAAALEAMIDLVGPDTPPPWVEVRAVKLEGVEYAIYFKAEWRHLANAGPMILQSVLIHLAQAGLEPAGVRMQNVASDIIGVEAAAPSIERLAALLGASALFVGVPFDDLRRLAERARIREFPADRVIAQSGEAGTAMFLVLEGMLSAESNRRTAGRVAAARMLRPGDIFDPAVALLGAAHCETVRTRTPALLCEIDHEALQALISGGAAALHSLAVNLATHVRSGPGTGAGGPEEITARLRRLFPSYA